jgi:hypothetical protein
MASDYLPITLDRLKKYFPNIKRYLGINSQEVATTLQPYYDFDKTIIYNGTDPYAKKVHDILIHVNEDYVFYLIDNNIFVDTFAKESLEGYVQEMVKQDIHQLRMLPGGITKPTQKTETNIYPIHHWNYIFSGQPTIWKKTVLQDIMSQYIGVDYREIELAVRDYTRRYTSAFIYTEKDIEQNEMNFSYGCPVIHALTYGKWINESEFYKQCLIGIQTEYGIRLENRGFLI